MRRPGSDSEETYRFPDDDPFFSEVSVLIDNIEDIEEDPETSRILCSFEGTCDLLFEYRIGIDVVVWVRCVQVVPADLGDKGG